jgi:hypothetical protein
MLCAGEGPIKLVAGDADTGFWRLDPVPAGKVITEACSWGQLTSGRTRRNNLSRALWMTLLPFTLANMAFWARRRVPVSPDQDKPWPPTTAGVAGYLIRVLCLSLTGTLTLAAVGAGADLVAWQCDAACPTRIPGLGFLRAGWWSVGARPLAVGLLAPVILLVGLWLLARRTFQYEAVVAHTGEASTGATPTSQMNTSQLDNAAFWQGEGQVRRLAMLHLAFGGAVAGLTVLGATLSLDPPQGVTVWVARLLLGILAVALLTVLVTLAMPSVVGRSTDPRYGRSLVPLALAAAGVLGTGVYALLADPARISTAARTLPVYGGAQSWLFALQFLMVLAVAGLMRWGWHGLWPAVLALAALVLGRFTRGIGAGLTPTQRFVVVFGGLLVLALVVVVPWRRGDAARRAESVWNGQAAALLAGLGWLVCALYSAAAEYRLADYLNAGEPTAGDRKIHVPIPLSWSATGLTLTVVVVVVVTVVAWRLTQRIRGRLIREWDEAHPDAPAAQQRRWHDVASAEALHSFVERYGLRLLGWLAVPLVVLLAAGVAGGFSTVPPAKLLFGSEARPNAVVAWLSDTGATLAGLLFAGLVGVGYLAYRNDTARRTIGIVWDLGTFWPRSAHPFAPPCYAERVVPQLVTRICNLPDSDGGAGIILAGHSQGSTIAAATVRQLPPERRERVFLLTFGTQLNRLYGRVFPAFFGPDELARLAEDLSSAGTAPRWHSFYRRTDPMGFPVEVGTQTWSVDEPPLDDPVRLVPTGGEVVYPKICGHNDYPNDTTYLATRDVATSRLLRSAAPVEPPVEPPVLSTGSASPGPASDRA